MTKQCKMRIIWGIIVFIILLAYSGCDTLFHKVFSVSGVIVIQESEEGLGGVELLFSNDFGTATTDLDGRWQKNQLEGRVTIEPSKDGWSFVPSTIVVTNPESNLTFFAYPYPSYNVSGRVEREDGIGIPNVEIEFSNGFESVFTGTDGEWSKGGLEGVEGVVTISPKKEDWSFRPSNFDVRRTTEDILFRGTYLPESYTVSGQVKRSNGIGIPNVEISFSGGYDSVFTDTNGRWSKGGLEGVVTVRPIKEGWTFSPSNVDVIEKSTDVDFEGTFLLESYVVSGAVLRDKADATSGIPNAEITFSGGFVSVFTDTNGKWRKSGLEGVVTVRPIKDGWTFSPSNMDVIEETTDVDFEGTYLPETYRVSGKVEDMLGKPIPDVTISFSNGFEAVTTSADGSWEKSSLEGVVTVVPSKPGWVFSPANRDVKGEESGVDFKGVYRPDSYTVSGRVEKEDGEGIPNVEITFSNGFESVVTGTDGEWSKGGLEGVVTVRPIKEGWSFRPPNLDVIGPTEDILFRGTYLPESYRVSGKIEDVEGNPIPEVTISFSNGFEAVTTSADGSWEKSGLEGVVTVVPSKPDWVFSPANRDVTGAAVGVDFEGVYRPESYTVSGRVEREDGEGIPNVEIAFSNGFESVVTGADGEWSKGGLEGVVTIRPIKEGWSFRPSNLDVRGPTENLLFRGTYLPESYAVSGSVLRDRAVPTSGIPNVEITFSGGYESVFTDTEGQWSRGGLEGVVTVRPVKEDWTFSPSNVDVIEAAADVDFEGTYLPESYAVSGAVLRDRADADSGIPNVEITFSGGYESVFTDAEGQWRKGGLEGVVTVTPIEEDWTFSPSNVDVIEETAGVNFEGTYLLESYAVSGAVLRDMADVDSGIPNVEITFSGDYESVFTGTDGQWSKSGLEGVVTVTPIKEDWTFSPSNVDVIEETAGVNFEGTYLPESYTVSGYVLRDKDDLTSGIPDVELFFEGQEEPIRTGADGRWIKTRLEGAVTITPLLEGWSFNPANRDVFQEETDIIFEGTPTSVHEIYGVSGRIMDAVTGDGVFAVVIHFKRHGEVIGTAITESGANAGNWSKSRLWGDVQVEPQGIPPAMNELYMPESITVSAEADDIDFVQYGPGSPRLLKWDLNMDSGRLRMVFDKVMRVENPGDIIYGDIFIQDNETSTVSYPLTGSSTRSNNSKVVVIDLHVDVLNALKQDATIATTRDNTWLIVDEGAIRDINNLDVIAIPDGLALKVDIYTADTTEPDVVDTVGSTIGTDDSDTWDDGEELVITFTEPLNAASRTIVLGRINQVTEVDVKGTGFELGAPDNTKGGAEWSQFNTVLTLSPLTTADNVPKADAFVGDGDTFDFQVNDLEDMAGNNNTNPITVTIEWN